MTSTSFMYVIQGYSAILPTNEWQTSGAKIFSSHAGFPADQVVTDKDAKLNEIQKSQEATLSFIQPVSLIISLGASASNPRRR